MKRGDASVKGLVIFAILGGIQLVVGSFALLKASDIGCASRADEEKQDRVLVLLQWCLVCAAAVFTVACVALMK